MLALQYGQLVLEKDRTQPCEPLRQQSKVQNSEAEATGLSASFLKQQWEHQQEASQEHPKPNIGLAPIVAVETGESSSSSCFYPTTGIWSNQEIYE